MTHASLFSGIGGAEVAASWMGWENVFHCEINPFGRKVLDYWFPNSKSYEDITKTDFTEWRGKVDILTGGFPCFKSGTKVMTSEGLKNIEKISIGDLILTKEGRYMACNAIMNKVANEIFGIKSQGLYEPTITTRDHPFFVKRKKENEAIWVNAGDIKKGDMVAYRCIDGILKIKDEKYWYMVGRFLGDGWILDGKRKSKIEKGHRGSRINSINHKVVICCNKKESECLKSIILNAGYKYTFSSDRTTDKFIICSQELAGELMNFGRYSFGKKLSKESFQLENSRKKALFEGWLSADGYIEKNGSYKITTVSEELAIGMASIARDVYKCPVSISKKTVNRICKIEGRVVNERPQYCITVSNCNKYGYYKDGFVWCLVKKVYKELKEVKVYNIGVLEDETYTANGITVHNCQPFSQAGKRKGDTDDRYLWPEMLRAIREIQPTWVVGENVDGITNMVESGEEFEMGRSDDFFNENYVYRKEQEFTIERICKDFESVGYSVQPIVIPACAVGAPHRRDRVWFVAHRNDTGTKSEQQRSELSNEFETVTNTGCSRGNKIYNEIESEQSDGNGINCASNERIITNTNGNGRLSPRESFGTKEKKCIISQQSERRFSTERTNGLFGFQQSIADPIYAGNTTQQNEVDTNEPEKMRRGEPQSEFARYVSERYAADTESKQSKRAELDGQSEAGEQEQGKFGGICCKNANINAKYTKNNWSNFPTQSPICCGDDGISNRLDGITFPKWRAESIKAYGNAWVPQVAYEIFNAIRIINN